MMLYLVHIAYYSSTASVALVEAPDPEKAWAIGVRHIFEGDRIAPVDEFVKGGPGADDYGWERGSVHEAKDGLLLKLEAMY